MIIVIMERKIMADITKVISGNPIKQGAAVLGVQRGGSAADIISLNSHRPDCFTVEAIQSGYDTRFDDYGLRRKTLEIGDWNMDANASVAVSHGLSDSAWRSTRSIELVIRDDSETNLYDSDVNSLQNNNHVSISGINSGSVVLTRTPSPSGFFDNTNFDSTSYNRGWITVWYE